MPKRVLKDEECGMLEDTDVNTQDSTSVTSDGEDQDALLEEDYEQKVEDLGVCIGLLEQLYETLCRTRREQDYDRTTISASTEVQHQPSPRKPTTSMLTLDSLTIKIQEFHSVLIRTLRTIRDLL